MRLNQHRQCQQCIIEHHNEMEAIAEDLIYSVINWVQTLILTLCGGLLQTEVWSYAEGNKRLWPHAFFQRDTRLLCQEAQCPPELWWNYRVHVSTANSQGKNQVIVERNQLWLFLSRSPMSSWTLPELPHRPLTPLGLPADLVRLSLWL